MQTNNDIKFSVLIPVYAKENALNFKKAVESITQQTLLPNEILIIEDGILGDELENVVLSVEKDFPNITRVIRLKENIGIAKVRALGVDECKYEWLAFMDSDDISVKNRFEKQIAYLKEHTNIDMLGAQTPYFIDTPDNVCFSRIMPEKHKDIYNFGKFRMPVNTVTLIFKKQNAIDCGNFTIDVGFEDYEFVGKFLKAGNKVVNMPDNLVYVRTGSEMMSRRKGLKYFGYEYACMKSFLDIGYINFYQFCRNLVLKFPLRVMPDWMRNLIYKKFLRKEQL